ncbi:hypothetical protein SR914_19350 [Comamonas testosteroni]|uniref:Uncharacterized protein n=1 Tax=Comamonas testosteroni (strain DSM 14576 / KF-1) TaxID=399795 RepID=B7WRF4_COMTK|nr:hypothetical protein [Comamonas testosteroni]EED67139.1 hypothetical protein CtesDRAFT_PD2085 [Comamonas testosteroni KF-1]WQG65332.1 hypothetical protein SR914_19350 [Comamonas testosteroni]
MTNRFDNCAARQVAKDILNSCDQAAFGSSSVSSRDASKQATAATENTAEQTVVTDDIAQQAILAEDAAQQAILAQDVADAGKQTIQDSIFAQKTTKDAMNHTAYSVISWVC